MSALVYGWYCRALGIHVAFLQGESGLYLNMAFATIEQQREFISQNMLKSYAGHFTPVVFMAEFLQSKLFRANESLWFWRQMLVCAMLGATIACYIAKLARYAGLVPAASLVVGVASAVSFLCQPVIIELVTWPFMALQLLMLSTTVVSGYFLLRFIETQETRYFARFVLTAYFTMHIFGVGIAVSSSALVTGAAVLVLLKSKNEIGHLEAKRAVFWIAVALVLTGLHAIFMLMGAEVPSPVGEPLTLMENLSRFGWLLIDSSYAGLRMLWANGGFQWPDKRVASVEAVYGLGLLTIGLAFLAILAVRYLSTRDKFYLVGFGLVAFPLFAMVASLALIVFRLREVQGDDAVMPYLIGGRYLIFPTFFVSMTVASLFVLQARVLGTAILLLPLIAAVTCAIGTAVFVFTFMEVIWPNNAADSKAIWRAAVSDARQDVMAGRVVRNYDLSKADPAFKSDLKGRRNLLEKELGCKACVRFDGE